MLNIKSDGTFAFVVDDKEGVSDTSDTRLSESDRQQIQAEIDTMQAHNLQELHLEKSATRSFVHKVGSGSFVEEDDPDVYQAFNTLDQWGASLGD